MLPMLLGRMSWMAHNGPVVAFSTLVVVFFIVVLNFDKRGFWLVAVGAVLNIVTMAFHGLKMPIYLTGLRNAGHVELLDSVTNNAVLNYVGIETFTQWSDYLGKVIVLPSAYPLAQVITVGDALMSIGLFLFVMGQMTSSVYSRSKSRMVNTYYPKGF